MDNAYNRDDVLEMEVQVLNTLKFELTTSSPLQFLEFFARAICGRESELHLLAQFCLECALIDHEMTTYLPSQLACVALYVASRVKYPNQPVQVPGPYGADLMMSMEDELLKVGRRPHDEHKEQTAKGTHGLMMSMEDELLKVGRRPHER